MYLSQCEQCHGGKGGLMVILPNKLWLSIAKMREIICHYCIEQRLGRKIAASDFPVKPVRIYANKGNKEAVRTIPVNKEFFEIMGIKFSEAA